MIIKEQENEVIYSDGQETENNMLQIASEYPEDKSEDFIAHNSSYTINNTFSSVRRNILNWYPFQEHSEILEVGAGMGAVTGLLCDVAEHVTAIEMSQARAAVIRARYPERDNLTVLSQNINSWDTDKRFDYAVFIGVMEYAAIFSDSPYPYVEFLSNIKKFLKPNGKILFAIENRFGLKYWLGGSEDHLQEPFAGIKGYEDKKGPRTFSRKELKELLMEAGLPYTRFYSVLPDYKFPELIFSDEYEPNYMNLKKVSFTYSKNSTLLADEKQLYKDIIANGVFPFFANSFLVEASACKLEDKHAVLVSAKGEVYKEYRVSTIMDNAGKVYKVPMHKNAAIHIRNILKNTNELLERGIRVLPIECQGESLVSDRFYAPSAQDIFASALRRNDWPTLKLLLGKLKNSLQRSSDLVEYNINNILVLHNIAESNVNYGYILQKAYVDMTLYNAFWVEDELVFYDQEWCFERVPLNFCVYYSLKSAYGRAEVCTNIQLNELIEYMEIGSAEINAYDKLENLIWSKVFCRQTDFYGEDGYCNRYSKEMTLQAKRQYLEDMIENLQKADATRLEKNVQLLEEKIKLEKENNALKEINILELETNAKLKRDVEALEEENLKLRDTEKRHQAASEEVLAALRQTILNKEGHIQLLLETEREYEREKHSRTYRMALVFRRISTFFLPVGSKRRFFCRVLAKGIRHPLRMIRMATPHRIKNCFTILRTEGTESAALHLQLVEEFERSGSVDATLDKLDIAQVGDKEVSHSLEDYLPLHIVQPDEPMVSIIIPAYNQFDYTYHCLESVQKHSGDVSYEILLADDSSTDLTAELEKIVTGIRHIRNQENLRFLRSCNYAAKQARGKYILFLNNDTQVQQNWLQPLVDLAEADNTIGIVGSKLVYSDGHLQEAGGIFWKDASAWNYGHLQNPEDPEYNYVKEADYVSGASLMIRRSLWEEIGGFDERFAPAYYEDSDLAFEVRKHGYKVVYQPLSVVVHFEGISNGKDITTGQKAYQAVNQKKFYDKWKDILEEEHFSNGEKVFLAKDRSRNKKQILVVDHYVPHYDKDAGGKCTYMYLLLFAKMGLKVTFIGDNFYKHEPYTTDLNQHGIEVLYGNYYFNNWKEWLENNLHYFDYVYLQRPHISIKYIDLVKKYSHAKVFYFAHDLHHIREYREYMLTHDEEKLKSSEHWKKIEYELFEKADVGHVVGSYEQEIMQKAFPGKPIRNIPLYIYEEMLTDINKDFRKRHDLLYVGGFGHPPNIDAVMWFGKEVFPKIIEVYPDMKWHVVGGKVPAEVEALASDNIIIEGFLSDEKLHKLYRECRMAVVPLRVGAGVKGKVVEAAYFQIPLVTTTIGAEGLDASMGNMVVEDDADRMTDLICSLYRSCDQLKEMSDAGEAFIREYFTAEEARRVLEMDTLL